MIGTIGVLTVVWLVSAKPVGTTSTPATDQGATASVAAAQMVGTVAPVPATATPVPATATPVPATATPAVGEVIPLPADLKMCADLSLVRAAVPPAISQQAAMQAIADQWGVPWALGGQWEGKPVTVQAWYGLATFGEPNRNGQGWIGDRNIRLITGEVLDHIENRPVWIIDYGNTVFHAAGCPGCPPPPKYNPTVYAVDVLTGTVMMVWPYVGH
jgi:hypothetical protein